MTLEPCPFCGSPAEIFQAHYSKRRTVQCSNEHCGVRPFTQYATDINDAIHAWNTRADNFTAPRRGVPEAQKPPRQETGPSPANLEGTR